MVYRVIILNSEVRKMREIEIALTNDGFKIVSQFYGRQEQILRDGDGVIIQIVDFPDIEGRGMFLRGADRDNDFLTLVTNNNTLEYLKALSEVNKSSVEELVINSWDFHGNCDRNNINSRRFEDTIYYNNNASDPRFYRYTF